ncbi:Uncharacterised protein [uncultured Ruminococcus sp.]|nr:Uncharacterised protein [uncultured Ruminococcus sp.]SCH32535.1 Uncharacterised protein [uncultured Clostridium sp.]
MGFGETPDKNGTVIMMTVPFLSFKEKLYLYYFNSPSLFLIKFNKEEVSCA